MGTGGRPIPRARQPEVPCGGCREPVGSSFVRVRTSRLAALLYGVGGVVGAAGFFLVAALLEGRRPTGAGLLFVETFRYLAIVPGFLLVLFAATRPRVRVARCPRCGTTTRQVLPGRWDGFLRVFRGWGRREP